MVLAGGQDYPVKRRGVHLGATHAAWLAEVASVPVGRNLARIWRYSYTRGDELIRPIWQSIQIRCATVIKSF